MLNVYNLYTPHGKHYCQNVYNIQTPTLTLVKEHMNEHRNKNNRIPNQTKYSFQLKKKMSLAKIGIKIN